LRGAFSEAARFGEESFRRRPTPEGAYDVACALARAGDSRKAVEYLERAKELGYSDVDAAATDPDLASLHGLPAFDTSLSSLPKSATSCPGPDRGATGGGHGHRRPRGPGRTQVPSQDQLADLHPVPGGARLRPGGGLLRALPLELRRLGGGPLLRPHVGGHRR